MAAATMIRLGGGFRRSVLALRAPTHVHMDLSLVAQESPLATKTLLLPSHAHTVMWRAFGSSLKASRSVPAYSKRQLILAVDNSQDSQYAVDWTVANVYRKGVPVERLPYNQQQKIHLDQARSKLAEKYSHRMASAGVDYEFNVLCEEGAAFGAGIGDNIVSMANEIDATAVVVSSHRKSMLAEFMMGSISNFLVHQCEKPVIVLHAPRSSDSEQHLEAAENRNIVLAVDTSASSEKMARWTINNITRPGDHVHALHVIPAIPTTPVYQVYAEGIVSVLPGPTEDDVEERRTQLHADLSNRLQALLPVDDLKFHGKIEVLRLMELKGWFSRCAEKIEWAVKVAPHAGSVKMSIHIVEEDAVNPMESVGSAICHKAEELKAAALVCMSGHKGPIQELFMGSVSSYLSHKSETPVLVLE